MSVVKRKVKLIVQGGKGKGGKGKDKVCCLTKKVSNSSKGTPLTYDRSSVKIYRKSPLQQRHGCFQRDLFSRVGDARRGPSRCRHSVIFIHCGDRIGVRRPRPHSRASFANKSI